MKYLKKALIGFLAPILIIGTFFFSSITTEALLLYDFGGRVLFTVPCSIPPGVWYVVGGLKGGSFINTPPISQKSLFLPPFKGATVLGKSTTTPILCCVDPSCSTQLYGLFVLYNGISP